MTLTRLLILSLVALALLIPTPAAAFAPVSDVPQTVQQAINETPILPSESSAGAWLVSENITPHVCSDVRELAGILMVEGGAQPLPVQITMGQIIVNEARQRGLSVCALSRLTWFVSVRRYAIDHPASWTAKNIDLPSESLLITAQQVIDGNLPDTTGGMGHFDGDGTRITFRP